MVSSKATVDTLWPGEQDGAHGLAGWLRELQLYAAPSTVMQAVCVHTDDCLRATLQRLIVLDSGATSRLRTVVLVLSPVGLDAGLVSTLSLRASLRTCLWYSRFGSGSHVGDIADQHKSR